MVPRGHVVQRITTKGPTHDQLLCRSEHRLGTCYLVVRYLDREDREVPSGTTMNVVDFVDQERRCFDVDGIPLCGAPVEGAFLVDHFHQMTCPVCIALTTVPLNQLVRRGEA